MTTLGETVPHAEYARLKTHLYRRINILRERAERAEKALAELADVHHRTRTNSKLHDPENQEWRDCRCRSCRRVAGVLKNVDHAYLEVQS